VIEALFSIGVIFGGAVLFKLAVAFAQSQEKKEFIKGLAIAPVVLGVLFVIGVVIFAVVKWAFGVVF